ncbi:MAG: hypothetical protein EOO05_21695 [Chitinophagaceae bacterium]|nr:MAG: hypothetical protein EOO05_21695 [Chitinophagaceae bacterium]
MRKQAQVQSDPSTTQPDSAVQQGESNTLKTQPDSALQQPEPQSPKPLADTSSTSAVAVPGAGTYQPAVVTKKGESSTTLGFGLTFVDEYNGQRDTIRILIPRGPQPVTTVSPAAAGSSPAGTALPVNCRNVAGESDLQKAKKRMQQVSKESAMLAEGEKLTRSKCITTEQLRELALLFPGDGGRLKMYEQSYSKVADPANFAKLESDLHDDYFIGRFRALLR